MNGPGALITSQQLLHLDADGVARRFVESEEEYVGYLRILKEQFEDALTRRLENKPV